MHPAASGAVTREGFADSGSGRLYVRDVGRGPPVVAVHGGPDFDHEYLLPDLDRLGGPFHLVYYDQRGRGRSFVAGRPDVVTIATEVDDLDRVREWFGLESVALLGHSWGGLLAMEYAIRHPDRVSHLILMNSAPASAADARAFRDAVARRRTPAQNDRMQQLRADPRFQAGDIGIEAEYYRIHFAAGLRNPDQLDAVVRRLRSSFTAESVVHARVIEDSLYKQTWSRDDYDLFPALSRLEIPTLLVHGDHDFVPIGAARHIAEALRGSRLVVLPGCGHFAYLEHPDLTVSTITAFLTPP